MDHADQSTQAFRELALHYERTVDDELRKAWGVSYAAFVEQLLDFAAFPMQGRFLDIATGTGVIPRALAAQPARRIIGLDITYRALQTARGKVAAAGLRREISLTCATAAALPFAPGSFDGVICALATHHIPQDDLLTQASAALKPGGRLVLADAAASPFWRVPGIKTCLRLAAFAYFLFTVSPARAWVESRAVDYVHTVEDWSAALRRHGFTAVTIRQPARGKTILPSAFLATATKEC